MDFNFEKSYFSLGFNCCFMQIVKNGAPTPNDVISASSANFHNVSKSGYAGLPSYKTMDAPVNKFEMRMFHMTHPVVVYQKTVSCCRMLFWMEANFICSTTMPPCP